MPVIYLMPLLSEILMISSALCMAIGWVQIRRGRRDVHRRLMLWATGLAAAFFVNYLSKSLIFGDTSFGGPDHIYLPYMIFLVCHILLATVAAILGIVTIRRAIRGDFVRHKRLAPWTAVIWFVTTASGLVVYLMLYVIYPPGPTVPFWQYFSQ